MFLRVDLYRRGFFIITKNTEYCVGNEQPLADSLTISPKDKASASPPGNMDLLEWQHIQLLREKIAYLERRLEETVRPSKATDLLD
jgi:hypothetical protein